MAPTYFFADLGVDFALQDALLLHDFDGKDPPGVPVDSPLDSAPEKHIRSNATGAETATACERQRTMSHGATKNGQSLIPH